MEGNATFRFAVKAMQEGSEGCTETGWGNASGDIDWIVPIRQCENHANVCNACIDKSMYINMKTWKHLSSASIPLALGEMVVYCGPLWVGVVARLAAMSQ